MLATLISGGGAQAISKNSSIISKISADFVLSIIFFFLLPIFWFLVYRILYRAARFNLKKFIYFDSERKTKPSLYIIFWIFYFIQLLSFAFFVVGFPGTGAEEHV